MIGMNLMSRGISIFVTCRRGWFDHCFCKYKMTEILFIY